VSESSLSIDSYCVGLAQCPTLLITQLTWPVCALSLASQLCDLQRPYHTIILGRKRGTGNVSVYTGSAPSVLAFFMLTNSIPSISIPTTCTCYFHTAFCAPTLCTGNFLYDIFHTGNFNFPVWFILNYIRMGLIFNWVRTLFYLIKYISNKPVEQFAR